MGGELRSPHTYRPEIRSVSALMYSPRSWEWETPLAPSARICRMRSSSGETAQRALAGAQHADPRPEKVLTFPLKNVIPSSALQIEASLVASSAVLLPRSSQAPDCFSCTSLQHSAQSSAARTHLRQRSTAAAPGARQATGCPPQLPAGPRAPGGGWPGLSSASGWCCP